MKNNLFSRIEKIGTDVKMTTRVLFLLFFTFLPYMGISQQTKLDFENISVQDGLSSYFVNCIIQDSRGFIWIGTKDGLNRYDGFNFIKYHFNASDSNSISHDYVNAICEDSSNNGIWVGTNRGLNFFDFRTEKFTCFYHLRDNSKFLCHNNVSSLSVCKWGGIWVATRNGLDRIFPVFDTETGAVDTRKSNFVHFKKGARDSIALSGNSINCIYQDKTGVLWIGYEEGKLDQLIIDGSGARLVCHGEYSGGVVNSMVEDNSGALWLVSTGAGLVKYDPRNKTFSNRLNRNKSGNWINAICKGTGRALWLGAYNDGLTEILSPEKVQEFGADTTVFKRYQNIPEDLATLTDNWIRCLYMDQSGVLWAGTRRNGIVKVSFLPDFFEYHSFNSSDTIVPYLQEVNSIIEDKNGLIWVGTANGLNTFDRETKISERIIKQVGGKIVSPKSAFTLCEDKNGKLWIGTYGNGLYRYNQSTNNYTILRKQNGDNLSSDDITSVTSLQSGDLIIGTSSGGIDKISFGELNKIKPEISPFLPNLLPTHEKFTRRRKVVFEDSKGIIWITTVLDGLYKYNPIDQTLKHYPSDERNPNSISDDHISSICESEDGLIWVATDKGLDAFDVETEIFKKYYTNKGLPDNTIIGVHADKSGHVWALTRKWISRLDPKTEKIRNFNYYHRVVTGLFTHKRICEAADGKIFVGTQRKGFFSFFPDSIIDNSYRPPIVITSLLISGIPVPIGEAEGQIFLKRSINHTKEVELKYDKNNLTIGFTGLSYLKQNENQYACILEGAQKEWQNLEVNRRSINYFNLNSGVYTFKVKAANSDGVWNDIFASLRIIILPPWWLTWQAYIVYFILLVILLKVFYRYSSKWISLKNKLKLEKLEKEKMAELNKLKLRFFTNISHEFRTPLSLIVGPIENLISRGNNDAYAHRQLRLMHGNTNRLLRLINQLMDFRKDENKGMKLNAEQADIVEFTKEIFALFEELADQHGINFSLSTKLNQLKVYFDKDKLDKILFNLLSNAFKFTNDNGEILVEVKSSVNRVEIVVKDSGKGIDEKDLEKIFDRFFQVDHQFRGTGIGLSLSKSFVQLHHGEIFVESKKGAGTSFTISLPLGRGHLQNHEICLSESKHKAIPPIIINEQIEDNLEEQAKPEYSYRILIVEDNVSLRNFIKEGLQTEFTILEAENGKQALEIALIQQPSLIISDVMMPEMDGIELCKQLKSDDRLSHIPLILLSALSCVEDVFTGYKSGADDYIPKPFNPQLLSIRAKNLIEANKNLKKRFQREITLEPKDITITSADEKLLEKIMKVVENRLSDSEFTVEKMGTEIGLSRVHLNRKIKALTDQTATDFIRTIRMKQAAKLLVQKKLNVSEIAYMVGFSNPISFGRSFKKHFGCAPSEYIN